MVNDIRYEDLPASWNSFDLAKFSRDKQLWDYQQEAIKAAIKALWKYFEDHFDYESTETIESHQTRKHKSFQWYKDNGLDVDLSLNLDKSRRNIYNLLSEYYPHENGDINYENFINRMCFWMATGSGKTLVIIKLIQIIKKLIEIGEIPSYDILILTHRDDLLTQLGKHVDEFNYANNDIFIKLQELKEYADIKRQQVLFKETDITVYCYRSDNLSDEQKEKIIDFRNYDNDGKWYIFLDEAHKGDKEESKRQHIYSILSRNGFLFNSSATFTDQKDIITTAYNFNLERFINSGYGKHITILKQENRAFRDNDNYTDDEKQKIVLKTLISITYTKKIAEEIHKIQANMYHNPLILTLVNSVHKEDADLKLFFREIEKIGKGLVEKTVYESAIEELWGELKEQPELMFENDGTLKVDELKLKKITHKDILKYVFNSNANGEIEILIRPSNKQELALKLKTSDKPFALIKIGDISDWLKNEFSEYEINEKFDDESFFYNLNKETSDINILMGSRSFYEGWDSNRPNVINYINIGIGEDATKFILQSVGRGVRIEPIEGMRKRLLPLSNAGLIDTDIFQKLKDNVQPIETLQIFGTNWQALKKVIDRLEKTREDETKVSLNKNPILDDRLLLVPTYKQLHEPILSKQKQLKFPLSEVEFHLAKQYIEYLDDDRLLIMMYDTNPAKIQALKETLGDINNVKRTESEYKNIDLLIQRYFDYLNIIPEEFDQLKLLEDEIKHFTDIKVTIKDIAELDHKIKTIQNFPESERNLKERADNEKLSVAEIIEEAKHLKNEETFEHEHQRIQIKYAANHYYIPLMMSLDDRADYIKHIIKHPSESKFVRDLDYYLGKEDNKFKEFDWWLFSKVDESLDEVYIPYFNPNANKFSYFYPDFIFWIKKGNSYYIVFIDPKGTEHTSAYFKIDGFKKLFEDNGIRREFEYNGFKVTIKLFLVPEDEAKAAGEYSQYWFDNLDKILNTLD